jgi:hypothetical protein
MYKVSIFRQRRAHVPTDMSTTKEFCGFIFVEVEFLEDGEGSGI